MEEKLILEEINDSLDNFEYDVLKEEASGKKKYFIRGAFSKADVINKNKRVYPLKTLKESVDSCQPTIKEKKMVGELEHPQSVKINLDRIAVKINQLSVANDGTMIGEMEILDTPCGKTLQTLVDSGIGLGVSTRGVGTVKKVRRQVQEGVFEDVSEVQPDYRLRAIDIVFDPSAGEYGNPNFVTEGLAFDNGVEKETKKLSEVWTFLFS